MSTGQTPVTSARKPAKRKRGGQPGNTNASCPRRRSRSGIELSGHTQRVLLLKERSSTEQSSTLLDQLNRAFQDVLDEKALIES